MQVMASAFGDQSYPKLPPIRKGSVKETQENGRDKTSGHRRSNFNRETHGLVRLPPIIRVDPSAPSPDLIAGYSQQDEADNSTENIPENVCSDNSSSKLSSRFSSKAKKEEHIKNNSESRCKELGRRAEQPAKREITKEVTCSSSAIITDLHLDQDDIRRPSISHFEIDKVYGYPRRGSKPASLLNTQSDYKRRRGSLIVSEPEKLHCGRRLAKSSPDLSSTRKQYGSPIRETKRHADKGRITDLESFHSIAGEFFGVEDHGNSSLQRGGKGKVTTRNLTQRQSSKSKAEFALQPQSSPCTPVLQLVSDGENDPTSAPREFRKSLGDIYGSMGATRERRISTSLRKKLPVKEDNERESLMVEGKTCPQNERLTARVSSPRPPLINKDSFLKVPQLQTKRDSLYDLQQILSLLSIENISGKTDSKQAAASSSVYDLREFLDMSRAKQDESSQDGNTASKLGVENPEPRRGSSYDLMEFLSLNASAKKKAGKEQGEGEAPVASTHFLFPGPNETGAESGEMRRSSAYDLMEFLSLSRQNDENLKTDSNQSEPRPSKPAVSLTIPTTAPNQETPRSTMPEAGPTAPASSLLSPRLPTRFKFKRESIYDLQEFLGILQKESEVKRLPDNSTEKEHQKDETPTEHVNRNLIKENSIDSDLLKLSEEPHKNRSLSIYDLREFLSIYTAQSQSNVGGQLRRKPSQISQSSIMINVSEDEYGNGCVDDVFLAVPVEAGSPGRKRSSIASVAEFNDLLNILNDTTRKKSTSDRGTPTPVSRHDSGGAKSLYDLGEFLSVLNTDDAPLRRRLSSVSDRGNRCPSSLSRNDSSGGSSLYDLEEFLAVLNDSGQGREGIEGAEGNSTEEIIIPVPQLPSRIDKNGNGQVRPLNLSDQVAE